MDYELLVNEAFKHYQNGLALSRSPLAATDLVTPALVLDPVTPTAEERGRALRIVLQWAVTQLAPTAPRFPLGEFRPLDDPTWRDPRWWRYNILRHRYLEQLHPDDFVEGGRFTETLLALTGIPSADVFFGERNRGVRMVAEVLAQQHASHGADAEICRLAVTDATAPLAEQPAAHALLTIAALFGDVFPRDLLLTLAAAEGIGAAPLTWLMERRYLLAGDAGAQLWLGPALRTHLCGAQLPAELRRRHTRAGEELARRGELLAAAHHFQQAKRWDAAADLLLQGAAHPSDRWTPADLRTLLTAFPADQPDAGRRMRLHLLHADLCTALGESDAAITAARAGLTAAQTPAERAEFQRRLGKLYEKRNARHALNYYDQAAAALEETDPRLPALLKDRGWLHILQRDWANATADLARGLALVRDDQPLLRADLLDALASLHRNQRDFPAAIACAREALALREAGGNWLAVAKSLGNLGLYYSAAGAYGDAVAAHREAMATYRRLGNQEMVATAWLNIGMAQHLAGDRVAAVAAYQACLALSREINLALAEVKALYNLAEANAELGHFEAAASYWQQGVEAAQRQRFDDQVRYFGELATAHPQLGRMAAATAAAPPTSLPARASLPPRADVRSPAAARIVALAQEHGAVTPRLLVEELQVSKPTATRYLRELAAHGALTAHGKGRATCYTAPAAPQSGDATLLAELAALGAELAGEYGLTALYVAPADCLEIVAAFNRLPDVLTFLRLEQQLATRLGRAVKLMPWELVGAAAQPLLQAVWVDAAPLHSGGESGAD